MEEYKSNSDKSRKEEHEKLGKVVTGNTKTKKKGGFQKVLEMFVPDDIPDAKGYIFDTIVVPAIKKIISDTTDALLYGGDERSGRRKPRRTERIGYSDYYDDERRYRDEQISRRNNYEFEDVVFESYGDAEATRDALMDAIHRYGVVSIGDYYDIAGISVDNYRFNKYGWTDISSSKIIKTREGWVIRLPKALPLN